MKVFRAPDGSKLYETSNGEYVKTLADWQGVEVHLWLKTRAPAAAEADRPTLANALLGEHKGELLAILTAKERKAREPAKKRGRPPGTRKGRKAEAPANQEAEEARGK